MVTQGRIPDELRGTLFRIGSGDSAPYDHWFDGDGWLCSLAFPGPDEPPVFRARYVNTVRRKAQERWTGPGRATRGAWTQRADGSVLANAARLPTNPSNTNLLLRDGKLLALCEGGPPAVLDPATLATLSPADPCGVASFFAAHPKADPSDGTLIGCGLSLGATSLEAAITSLEAGRSPLSLLPSFPAPLNFFELTPDAPRPTRQRAHALPFFTFVHDMALTPTRALVVLPPYVIPDVAAYASAILGQRAVGMCFEWRPELGTQVMVVDRATLELEAIVRLPDPAPTCYHVINAFEEHDAGGADVLSVQICEQRNGDRAQLEDQYKHIARAAFTPELQCRAVEYRLRMPGMPPGKGGSGGEASCIGRVELAATARPFELPDLHPSYVGRRAKYAYTWCLEKDTSTFADALQRIELVEGGRVSKVISFGEGRCAGSPLFVPRGQAEDDGFLLTFVYDKARDESDLVVLDAADLEGEPVATIALGQRLPPLFHGIWADEVYD